MNFQIGSEVEITTKFKSNLLWEEFSINTHRGKVIENPKWLGADYVCVATGKPNWPISMIFKENIIGYDSKVTKSNTRIFKVTSKKSNKTYDVVLSDGRISCNCLGFEYRKSCRHSKKVLDFLN
jgi:hypothetical protein